MIDNLQNTILKIHESIESISSLNDGIYFMLSVAAIIFSLHCLYSIFIHKAFRHKSKLGKIVFFPALALSLISIFDLILAGDIYPNLSAEKIARLFGESLSNGRIEEIADRKNKDTDRCKVLTASYRDQFLKDWEEKSKEFTDISSSADEFLLIEYHYKDLNFKDPPNCMVIIRTSKILHIAEDPLDILQCDYDFKIGLVKVSIPSRFLGNYIRWRINSFSYKKSDPYTMKEWLERFKNYDS